VEIDAAPLRADRHAVTERSFLVPAPEQTADHVAFRGPVAVHAVLRNEGGRIRAEVDAHAHCEVPCDRCLQPVPFQLDVRSTEDAAARIGSRSTFVAKKALAQARALGSDRIGQAVALLSAADLDVKGRTGLAPELVLEILVARLSRLARPARRRAPAHR